MSSKRADLPWLLLLAGGFALDIAVTWQRWNNPIVDTGREMNQPLRLLQGEMLYSDVRHIYGPLSPYLHALLYWIFGPSLNVLYGSGILSAAAIVLLAYDIARRFLGPAGAGAAAWVVVWVCVLNAGGSYVLPYSYNAVHGCVLGLATLDLLVRFVISRSRSLLPFAGALAGLAALAKTEIGFLALASGLLTAILVSGGDLRRLAGLSARFVLPALAIAVPVYAAIASKVGLGTLTGDSFLLLTFADLPPELLYFNRRISGFDQPVANLSRMLLAALRLGSTAGLVVALGGLLPRVLERDGDRLRISWRSGLLALLALSGFGLLRRALFTPLCWGDGIYRSLPLLTVVFLFVLVRRRFGREQTVRNAAEIDALIVLAFYAAASLGRVILRVVLETAHTASLLPAALVVLAVAAACELPALLGDERLRRGVRQTAVAFLFAYGAWTALVTIRIIDRFEWVPVGTERGTMRLLPEYAAAMSGAIDYVVRASHPDEPVACLPECTAINFLTDRPNPLREEIISSGYLDRTGEARTIERLEARQVRVLLIENRPSPEFGKDVFGRDYCRELKAWIDRRFDPVATFGRDVNAVAELGDRGFFIRAYERKTGGAN